MGIARGRVRRCPNNEQFSCKAPRWSRSGAASRTRSEEPPFTGNALEHVRSAVGKSDSRTRHQVLDGARDQHLTGRRPRPRRGRRCVRRCRRPLSPISSHSPVCRPARTSIPSWRTPAVIAWAQRMRARRSIEGRQKAVARGVDLAAAVAAELGPHQPVMTFEETAPAPVAQLGGALRRIDDVGEEHRGQDAIGLGAAPRAGDELLHLIQDGVACHRSRGSDRCPRPRPASRRGCVAQGSAQPSMRVASSPIRCTTSVGTRIDGRTCRTSVSIGHAR